MKRGKLFRSGQDGAAPGEATGPGKSTGKGPDRLVEAGVVDRGFYEALTDRSFESDRAAAKHFLREAGAGHSLHPLIDPTHAAGLGARRACPWRGGVAAPLPARQGRRAPSRAAVRQRIRGDRRRAHRAPRRCARPLPGDRGRPDPPPGSPRRDMGRGPHRADGAGPADRRAGAGTPARGCSTTGTRTPRTYGARSGPSPRSPRAPTGGPLVSVVIPVRNRPRVVASALQSVSAQTLEDWELVVVDDGSTDETPQVLAQWAARDKRIRVVTQDWAGVSAARNRGLKQARGRYVAFLDSDNRWRPDFLRLAVAAMHGQGLRAAYAAMALHEDERTRYRAHPYTYDDLLVHNFVDPNVLVVERDLARRRRRLRRGAAALGRPRLRAPARAARRPAAAAVRRLSTTTPRSAPPDGSPPASHGASSSSCSAGSGSTGTRSRVRVADRVPGRLSVIVPAHDDATADQAGGALGPRAHRRTSTSRWSSSTTARRRRSVSRWLRSSSRRAGCRYERLPRDLRVTVGWNLGFARSTGEHVVIPLPRAAVRPGWWEPLARRLTEPWVLGVQALVLNDDDTIRSAGLVFPVGDAAPCSLPGRTSTGGRREDRRPSASTRSPRRRWPCAPADLAELRGFDPLFSDWLQDVDLCLRAAARREGRFVLEPGSRVNVRPDEDLDRRFETDNRRHFHARWRGRLPAAENHRWDEAGFAVAHYESEGRRAPRPATGRDALRALPDVSTRRPPCGGVWSSRRSAAAPAATPGATPTSPRSLAASLTALGQDVVTHRQGAAEGPASRFDDVVLALRGLKAVHPVPGQDQRAVGDQPPRRRPGRGGRGASTWCSPRPSPGRAG